MKAKEINSTTLREDKNMKEYDISAREMIVIIIQAILITAVIVAFFALIFLFASNFASDANKVFIEPLKQEQAMEDSIVCGVITDKRIENGRVLSSIGSGIGYGMVNGNGGVGYYIGGPTTHSYVPTTYRIYVSNDYEYDGTTYTGEVFFEVSEAVYNDYSIGDWFDSQNLKSE